MFGTTVSTRSSVVSLFLLLAQIVCVLLCAAYNGYGCCVGCLVQQTVSSSVVSLFLLLAQIVCVLLLCRRIMVTADVFVYFKTKYRENIMATREG